MGNVAGREIPRSVRSRSDETERKTPFIDLPQGEIVDILALKNHPQLRQSAIIDITQRYEQVSIEATEGMSVVEKLNWFESTVGDLAVLDYAGRVSNEMRVRMTNIPGFGDLYLHALNSAELADHAQPHSRMLKAFQKMLYILNPEVKDPDGTFTLAAGLFPWFHDIMQLLRRAENETLPEHLKRDPRMLHEEEGAFVAKALAGLLAESAQISYEQANKVTSILAIYALCHDKQSEYKRMIHGEKKAFSPDGTPLSAKEIFDMYMDPSGGLDLTSLSGNQWVRLIQKIIEEREQQKPDRLPRSKNTEYGILSAFEQAFSKDIIRLLQDDLPAFKTFDPIQREALAQAMDINVLSDVFDMGFPYMYAIVRKLCGSKALHRPIAQVYTDLQDSTDIKRSDSTRSDEARKDIEYYMMLTLGLESEFAKNTRFIDVVFNTVVVHAVQSFEIQAALMKETQNANVQFSPTIHNLIVKRCESAVLKGLQKHKGVPGTVIDDVQRMVDAGANFLDIQTFAYEQMKKYKPANSQNNDYVLRAKRAIEKLRAIEKEAIGNLYRKPKPEIVSLDAYRTLRRHGVRRVKDIPAQTEREQIEKENDAWTSYSDADIQLARKNFHTFLKRLFKMAGKKESFAKKVWKMIVDGNTEGMAVLIPQGTTSLGDLTEVKTVHDMSSFKSNLAGQDEE